jgi:hypothetical protein
MVNNNTQLEKVAISSTKKKTELYIQALTTKLLSIDSVNEILIKIKMLELLCCLAEEDADILCLLVDLRRELRPDFTTILKIV